MGKAREESIRGPACIAHGMAGARMAGAAQASACLRMPDVGGLAAAPTCFRLQLHRHKALEGRQPAAAGGEHAGQLMAQRRAALGCGGKGVALVARLACRPGMLVANDVATARGCGAGRVQGRNHT